MQEFLHNVFDANRVIILAVYGQVFFVLALAIALQSWRHSRLALARHLQWLAAFGLLHALYEWGDIFIPFQEQYMALPLIDLLRSLQAILLAASFTCLFQFGVEMLRPLPNRRRWLRALPIVVLLLWIGWSFGPALSITADLPEWHVATMIIARYGIGFPGALLAAYGLWYQADAIATTIQLPQVRRTLRVAALALAGYSVLGGLVVLPAPFFPASRLNTTQLENLVLIPVPIFRGLLGLVLTVAIIRSLEAFRIELDRQLVAMEEVQVLATERDRIGREIHDGTLQTIYGDGLLLQTVERDLDCDGQQPLRERVHQSVQLLNQAVADMRGSIGALRPAPDGRSLTAGLQELAQDRQLRSLVDVELTLDIPEGQSLAPGQIGHLLAIANEGLSNVARHAQATRIHVSAAVRDGRLRLEIRDNGRGLPVDYMIGYGLRNMRDRARLLGGELSVESRPGHGTAVAVDAPWREEYERVAARAG
ncbi:MAG TPA: sensor histidine kinase [Roseiflexaceae bacterium]|nr:sensor histidine kinase [Roseiflexaceae bacterium]